MTAQPATRVKPAARCLCSASRGNCAPAGATFDRQWVVGLVWLAGAAGGAGKDWEQSACGALPCRSACGALEAAEAGP
ncbi:MAG: hypothetical protein ACYDB7_06435, partial [Mycobacteriales bacterium]